VQKTKISILQKIGERERERERGGGGGGGGQGGS